MIEILEKEKTYVIVKMDIVTYKNLNIKTKRQEYLDLVEEAKNSKAYNTHEELMADLYS
jgi:hypothetical protein